MPQSYTKKPERFRARLKGVCEGLKFVSETDSDVIPVFGASPRSDTIPDILTAIGISPAQDIAVADPEKFFSQLTANKEWFGGSSRRTSAERFKELKRVLDEEVGDLKVIRIGKIRITIYVLGRDRDGKVAGVKTEAIET